MLLAFTRASHGAGKLPYRRPPAYKTPCRSECTPEPALALERLVGFLRLPQALSAFLDALPNSPRSFSQGSSPIGGAGYDRSASSRRVPTNENFPLRPMVALRACLSELRWSY